jgi:ABC-2 type transport system ATP-binding protein
VSNLDLEVLPHEVFGLLGPNGSGKSTTLKMILGLLFPTRGQIAVLGRLPTDVAVKARIGFLPEESYLYPFLDARETLDFYGQLFKQPRRQRHRRIDTLLEMVGLSAMAYRRVGEYSKGMQRRIGLAQALINDPDLLILDEPTSGMDPIGTREFKDLIKVLAMRGKTVIVSSHLLADVEEVCDRVCILYGGKSRALGPVSSLLAQSDLTQITTDRLDDAQLAQIRQVLATSGKDIQQVSTPRDKLESLFLRIVNEAQQQRVATGGAIAGGAVPDFLRGEEAQGPDVIAELVAAAPTTTPAQIPAGSSASPAGAAQPLPLPPREEVLAGLIEPKPDVDDSVPPPAGSQSRPVGAKPTKPPAVAKTRKSEEAPPQADRSVIDDLLHGRDDRAEKQ